MSDHANEAETKTIHCKGCGITLGEIVFYKGKYILSDGWGGIEIGFRRCSICGRVFHWNAAEFSKNGAKNLKEWGDNVSSW